MPHRLDEFIHHQNVAKYERLLLEGTTPEEKKVLQALLAAEATMAEGRGWKPRYK
jgi:hypothetical protein